MMAAGVRARSACDQAGPAGLVRRAETVAGVAVKILVEEDVIAEVRVVGELWIIFQRGPPAGVILQKQPREPRGNLLRLPRQDLEIFPNRRTFDLEFVAIVMVESSAATR